MGVTPKFEGAVESTPAFEGAVESTPAFEGAVQDGGFIRNAVGGALEYAEDVAVQPAASIVSGAANIVDLLERDIPQALREFGAEIAHGKLKDQIVKPQEDELRAFQVKYNLPERHYGIVDKSTPIYAPLSEDDTNIETLGDRLTGDEIAELNRLNERWKISNDAWVQADNNFIANNAEIREADNKLRLSNFVDRAIPKPKTLLGDIIRVAGETALGTKGLGFFKPRTTAGQNLKLAAGGYAGQDPTLMNEEGGLAGRSENFLYDLAFGHLIDNAATIWRHRATRKNPLPEQIYGDVEKKKTNAILDYYEAYSSTKVKAGAPANEAQQLALDSLSSKFGQEMSEADIFNAYILSGRSINLPALRADSDKILSGSRSRMDKVANKVGLDSKLIQKLDKYLGNLSTRIELIAPRLASRLSLNDAAKHISFETRMSELSPLLKILRRSEAGLLSRKGKKTDSAIIAQALANGDEKAFKMIAKKYDKEGVLDEAWSTWGKVRDDMWAKLDSAGYKKLGYLHDFFPRAVKDYDGLQAKMGEVYDFAATDVERMRLLQSQGRQEELEAVLLDLIEEGSFAPKVAGAAKIGKSRQLDKLSKELMPFYAKPSEALGAYIMKGTNDIYKHEFFFGALEKRTVPNPAWREGSSLPKFIKSNVDDDIEHATELLLKDALDQNLSGPQIKQLSEMMTAYFGIKSKPVSAFIANAKAGTYAWLLAKPHAALTQLTDLGNSYFRNGIINTNKAIAARIIGKNKVSSREHLLINNASIEMANQSKIMRAADQLLQKSMFKYTDSFGKDININAALLKSRKELSKPNGVTSLRKEYNDVLSEPELAQLVHGISKGEINEMVKMHLFHKLSKVQPISRLNVPQWYLEQGNWRILYMLSTFTLKQLDIARREIFHELRKGHTGKAALNAVKWSSVLLAVGWPVTLVQDFLETGEVDPTRISEKTLFRTFSMFGFNKFLADNISLETGSLEKVFNSIYSFTPAAVADGIIKTLSGDTPEKIVNQIPIVGKLWYDWVMGGIEERRDKYNEQEYKERFGDD